jgi:2-polyprenyl-3-methyl-5-hydroxy-6-metoxy-1,4-benzoquinol methylase
MNVKVKNFLLYIILILSVPFRIIPSSIRRYIIFIILLIESRISEPKTTLKNLFLLKDKLDVLINERAFAYGKGEHPKHRLMKYHDFFISHIPHDSKVLDVGCGYGAVARSIAKKAKGVVVTGIDNNKERLNQAKLNNQLKNLDFIYGDILEIDNKKKYDVIVMSNILEHVEKRVDIIKKIVQSVSPKLILIRVPSFERNWETAMRKELGINFFSDTTHFIEHTREEFKKEMNGAGLRIDDIEIIWGEIWAKCTPQ